MRELTADTIIRVKTSRPPLTGDTRIRLRQIVDLKDWALEMAQDEAAPEGSVHHWSDGDHVKKNGKWVPLKNKTSESTMATSGVVNRARVKSFCEKHYGKYPQTKKEIRQFIKDTKSEEYNPKGKDFINRYTKRGLKELKELTGGTFDTVIYTTHNQREPIIEKGTAAQIVRDIPGLMMINKDNDYWTNEQIRSFMIYSGSTQSQYHIYFHEYAHYKTRPKRKEIDPEDLETARSISLIATETVDDLCAEYYVKKMWLEKHPEKGTITDEEKALFDKYGELI